MTVPTMIPICNINPHKTPAYFLYIKGHTVNDIIKDASTLS